MYELLKNVRIVDLTSIFLGPYATQLLGDLGADVIKIEPLDGDVGRSPRPGRSPRMGAGFLNTNRNKRSIALDLKRPEGRAVALRLAKGADAFVHNMRGQAAARLGLSYEEVRAVHPSIVYCHSAGFGGSGPYADEPAYDDVIQALSGLTQLNAGADGAPRFVPTVLCDKIVGLHLALALASGIAHRARTGEGCAIEVPMFEAMVSFLMIEHMAGQSFAPPLGPPGYERMLAKNRRPYATKDGYVAAMPYTTEQWQRFMMAIGRADLVALDWVADPVKRSAHVDALYQIIADAAASRTSAEWLALLKDADVPCAPANTLADLFDEPHLKAVQMFAAMTHPSEGPLTAVRSPFAVLGVAQAPDAPAPELGSGAQVILAQAGYSQAEVAELTRLGVLGSG